jgi:two-component sensor histidine kinase
MVESGDKRRLVLRRWTFPDWFARKDDPSGGYLFAIALSVLVLLARDAFAITSPGLFLMASLAAVSFSAFAAGTGPGLAAAVVSAAFAFALPQPADANSFAPGATAASLYAIAAALHIELIRRLHYSQKALADELQSTQARLNEQHILFRDLQHRVANNLQFASSALSLQKRRVIEDPSSAPAALDEAKERLVNMAIIYRRLYAPGQLRLSLSAYLEGLCLDLIDASTSKDIVCRVISVIDTLDDRKLVPVSLILTEIVTNAVKHAFDGETGEIEIHLGAVENAYVLTASDNGRGLPETFDPSMRNGQGLLIMQALTRQLRGDLEFSRTPQTTVRLSFPREDG